MSDLINPFDSILQQAAKLPESGALKPVTRRLNALSNVSIILIDVSGSMAETIESHKRKIDLLREALDRPLFEHEVAVAFHSVVLRLYSLQDIPEPCGGTALHAAIAQSIPYLPARTLVISDGKPDDPKQALCLAEKLSGIINTLYIGLEQDTEARAFMRQLARIGCGRAQVCDITNPQNQSLLLGRIQNLLEGGV